MIESTLYRAHLRLALPYAYPGFQARNREQAIVTGPIVQNQRIELANRGVDIGLIIKEKPGRSNSNNRITYAVDGYCLAQRFRATAEPLAPQVIANDNHGCSARLIFRQRKFSPQRQPGAQGVEETRGDLVSLKVRRRTWVREINFLFPERHHLFKGASASLPVLEVWVRIPNAWKAGIVFPNHHQAIRLEIRERREYHAFHQAEDCRVRTDAEG